MLNIYLWLWHFGALGHFFNFNLSQIELMYYQKHH